MGLHLNKGKFIREPKEKSFEIIVSVIKYQWKILKLQKPV